MGSARLSVSTLVLGLVLAAVVNVATGVLPPWLEPYKPWSWPVAIVLGVLVAALEWVRHRRQGAAAPVPPADPLLGRAVWNVPAAVATFTGRDGELARAGALLARGRTVVLAGPPGVGKSQLAQAYAAAHRGEFDLGWWVPAETRLSVIGSLAQLAHRVGVGDEDQETAAARAVQWLAGGTRWLLILDNVEQEDDLAGLVPSGGRVLMTSRDTGLSRIGAVVAVPPFDEAEATRFLLERTGSAENGAALELAREVGGLPLALEQAAAYCVQAGVTLDGYLQRYRSPSRAALWRSGAPVGRPAVARTFELAFAEAGRRDRLAVQLLLLLAYLAPATVLPRWVLVAGAGALPKRLAAAVTDPIRCDALLAVPARMSLVQLDGDGLQVHPLVQELLRTALDEASAQRWWRRAWQRLRGADRGLGGRDRHRWLERAARTLVIAAPDDTDDPGSWARWAQLLPHGLALLHRAGADSRATAVADVGTWLARYLYVRGELTEARRINEEVLALCRRVLPEDHPTALRSLNNLAGVLFSMGELAEARRINEEALALYRRVLGEEHPTTLMSLNNLAQVLYALGELTEARRINEQALVLYRRLLGETHPDTLTSTNNLALVLYAMGELAEARRINEQVLAVCRRVLGEGHPTTLMSLNNLALVFFAMGELAEARRLNEQVLAVSRRVLGEEHPTTLMSLNNLAQVLFAMDELDEARRINEQTLALYRRTLGEEHPSTLTALNNLGQTLLALDEIDEARRIHEEVYAACHRVLGEEHPSTLTAMNNLGQVLFALDELDEARRIHERENELCRRVLGPAHPSTLTSMNNLALVLYAVGEQDAAQEMLAQVVAERRRVLGEEHPDTLSAAEILAAMEEERSGPDPEA